MAERNLKDYWIDFSVSKKLEKVFWDFADYPVYIADEEGYTEGYLVHREKLQQELWNCINADEESEVLSKLEADFLRDVFIHGDYFYCQKIKTDDNTNKKRLSKGIESAIDTMRDVGRCYGITGSNDYCKIIEALLCLKKELDTVKRIDLR